MTNGNRWKDPGRGLRVAALTCACLFAMSCAPAMTRAQENGGPAMRLDAAARALEEGIDYQAAADNLIAVRQTCRDGLLGRHALLLMGALEIDPRNERRSPRLAAAFMARYLSLPEGYPWTRPLAATLYVLALEMGAEPGAPHDPLEVKHERGALRFDEDPIEDPELCNERARAPVVAIGLNGLPEFDEPTIPEQLEELRTARERLEDEVAGLERRLSVERRRSQARVNRLTAEIARQEAEIERLRAMAQP